MRARRPSRSARLMQSTNLRTAATGGSGSRATPSVRRRGVATRADHADDTEREHDGAAKDDPDPEDEPGGEHSGAEAEHERPDRGRRELVDGSGALGERGVGTVFGTGREAPRL